MRQPTVLLVDDDPLATSLLQTTLEPHGYRVTSVATGGQAEEAVEIERPSVVVLDLMLPDVDGFEVCKRLRQTSLVPIIVVTARTGHRDRLMVLRLGADDVVSKPYDPEELALRLVGIERRSQGGAPATPEPYRYGELTVDFVRHRTLIGTEEIGLTPVEQRLIETLARNAGTVCQGDELLFNIWGPHAVNQYATLHLHISRLRRKLGDNARRPTYILTRSRIGYLLPRPERRPETTPYLLSAAG